MDNAQKLALRTHILANTTSLAFGGGTATIADTFGAASLGSGDAAIIAEWYNQTASPDYFAWTAVSKQSIDNLIDKVSFTMVDSPPAATGNAQGTNEALNYQNRAMATQLKQANAQWLILGTGSIDGKIASVRKNFQDCLRQIPSGASGALQDGGWGAPANPGVVRLGMMKKLTNLGKVFSVAGSGTGNTGTDPRGSTTNPDVLTLEEAVTGNDIEDIKGLTA